MDVASYVAGKICRWRFLGGEDGADCDLYRMVCLFKPQFSLVLIVPIYPRKDGQAELTPG